MRLIFLDFDGVLNSILHAEVKHMKKVNSLDCLTKPKSNIDLHNVDILRLLVEKTKAKIVISSTWRKDPCVVNKNGTDEEKTQSFIDLFASLGWQNAPIIGITPNLFSLRGHEIAVFLDEFSKSTYVDDYIILDDDSDFILGELHELESRHLDRMNLLDKEAQQLKSRFWSKQKLVVTNKLVGLSYNDLIAILKHWEPKDELVKVNETYLPYLELYGKRF